jgi:hypothetical protein
MDRTVPARVAILLFFLFFFGLAVTLLALIDLHWTHRLFAREPRSHKTSSFEKPAQELP